MIRFSIGLRVYTSEMQRRKHPHFGEVFCEGVLGRAKGVVGVFLACCQGFACQQVYVRRQEMERGFVDWKRIGQKNIIEKAGSSNEWTNERTNDRDRDRDRQAKAEEGDLRAGGPKAGKVSEK